MLKNDSVKNARNLAIEKIRRNIENIYSNKKVLDNIEQLRHDICIPTGMYDRYKSETDKIRSIHKLIDFLKEKWIEQISMDDKVKKIVTVYFSVYNINLDYKQKPLTKERIKHWPDVKCRRYLRDAIENFIKGKNWTYEEIKINSFIWKSVISAMLFGVPKKIVLKNKESILKDYIPKVDDDLTIHINELTSMTDFLLIEEKIKRTQKRYQKKFNYNNSRRRKKLTTV